jgi:hypothetical protein
MTCVEGRNPWLFDTTETAKGASSSIFEVPVDTSRHHAASGHRLWCVVALALHTDLFAWSLLET